MRNLPGTLSDARPQKRTRIATNGRHPKPFIKPAVGHGSWSPSSSWESGPRGRVAGSLSTVSALIEQQAVRAPQQADPQITRNLCNQIEGGWSDPGGALG